MLSIRNVRDTVIAIAGFVWILLQLEPNLAGNIQARSDLAYWETMDRLNGGNHPFEMGH
jgi:hypothetical protein